MIIISSHDILYLGFTSLGWEADKVKRLSAKTLNEIWKAEFVASPDVCSQTFNNIESKVRDMLIIAHFLLTLHWLSKYPTMIEMTRIWKMCEKTCRSKI